MVHYIRFLSPPQVSETEKKLFITSAVIALTTDLGDAFFPEDVSLSVRLVGVQQNAELLLEQSATWKGGSRALKIALQCPRKHASQSVRMHVSARDAKMSTPSPKILDVWSMDFEVANTQRAEPLVDRELLLSNSVTLRIREETGDSIARHIWDASLGFLMYLERIISDSAAHSQVQNLVSSAKDRRLHILELGAGCGIVGIAFALLIKCDMLLTDLDDATEILQTNVQLASTKAGSTLRAEVLDWSSDQSDSLNAKYDLILVSDCIYNPDSSVHLVETLLRLAKNSPHTLILVGFKRRHYADDMFFECMKAAKFETLEAENIDLPHHASDYEPYLPTIEFYTYRPPT